MRIYRIALVAVAFCVVAAGAVSQESITVSFSETWIGNAYTNAYLSSISVTGSEGFPIDASLGAGTTLGLIDGFLFPNGRLIVSPMATIGWRNYLLFPSGRAVPSQFETGLGDEDGEPGLALVRVITLRASAPFALEIPVTEWFRTSVGVSPTLLIWVPGWAPVWQTDWTDQWGAYGFLYGWFRFFAPELHLAASFDVSPYLSFGIRTFASVSVADVVASIFDMGSPTLPFWDQARIGVSLELTARPPFSGLFRDPDQDPVR